MVSMGWCFRDVHPGKRSVSRYIKRQMTKLKTEVIGIMEKRKKKMWKKALGQDCRSDFLYMLLEK